jgi:Ni/Fe-hydrogenase 1 B-type cytochrome subunit
MSEAAPPYMAQAVQPVRRLQKVVRMTASWRAIHWLNALSILVAAVTGIYISNPYYSTNAGNVMAWNRSVHLYAAIVLDVTFIVIAYLYFFSRGEKRAALLVPTRENRTRFREAFLNAVTLNRRKRFDSSRPDPLNAFLFLLLHLAVAFQLVTGLQLYVQGLESGVSSIGSWWPWSIHLTTDWTRGVFGGIAGVRVAHHAAMYFIAIWAMVHIYFEVWRSVMWKEGDIAISFAGYKFGDAGAPDEQP